MELAGQTKGEDEFAKKQMLCQVVSWKPTAYVSFDGTVERVAVRRHLYSCRSDSWWIWSSSYGLGPGYGLHRLSDIIPNAILHTKEIPVTYAQVEEIGHPRWRSSDEANDKD
uniref:Uncharacterized protein n=1 Tax=Parascaris equorum TaxID=6256 RepID=A0A914RNC6_PAREQ